MSNSDLKRRGKEVERQGTNKTNCKFWLLDDLVGISDDFVSLVVGNLVSDRPKISLALAQLTWGLLAFFLLIFCFAFV